jgi:hypothetical protein
MRKLKLFWTPVFTGVTTCYEIIKKEFPAKALRRKSIG